MEAAELTQVADELRQLCEQYRGEVSSRRRTWPKSVKVRVTMLLQAEQSCEQVATVSGIPVATIYGWKMAGLSRTPQSFLPVQVVERSEAPVVAPVARAVPRRPSRRRRSPRSAPTIIVIAPNGLRFEGLDVAGALAIATRLGTSQ